MTTKKHDDQILDELSKKTLIGYAALCGFVLSLQQSRVRDTALRVIEAGDELTSRIPWKYEDLSALWRLAVQYRYCGDDFLELDDIARATIRSSSMCTMTAFKTALRKALVSASVTTNQTGGASLATQGEHQYLVETTLTRPIAQLIGKRQQTEGSRLRLAAAGDHTPKARGLTKYDGWDISYGDWICEFFTDGQDIFVAGLPESGIQKLALRGATYRLEWVKEIDMHKLHGLSGRQLSETIKAVTRGDAAAFDVH